LLNRRKKLYLNGQFHEEIIVVPQVWNTSCPASAAFLRQLKQTVSSGGVR
jgi:hypothetical protein